MTEAEVVDQISAEPPFRDGCVHVQDDRCATCIFRNGAFRGLRPGRRSEMVLEARGTGGAITCHETYDGPQAICRGFYDLPQQPVAIELARRLGLVRFVEAKSC